MNAPFEICSSKRLLHSFLTRKDVTHFSMADISKQRSIANEWKLVQGMKMASKRRQRNVMLEVFGANQFLVFLIFPAPAL